MTLAIILFFQLFFRLDKLQFYGINPNRENLLLRLNFLMAHHPHEDIREKCKALHDLIDNF